ncbi:MULTISPECIES: V-type ATP synthase subunit D [Terrabacteria group]|uniref:V-type ATP synthase subunit D n=1 Tax=Bacillati TaxID=1783272 RepID=UPI001C6DE89B|nr:MULTISPECIES: V-type ATP synthase subunit D [Terrabacteria group]MBW9212321.1 V-type ATP synthase subunit D [Trueperella sp. zg.1013]
MPVQMPTTKGNLLRLKRRYDLAKNGYDLMDRKRHILIKEMMALVEKVKVLREEISDAYKLGYYLLQQANMSSGIISSIAEQVAIADEVELTYRSVMGVEIPNVLYIPKKNLEIPYGLLNTSSRIDEVYLQFQKIKELSYTLAEVDNAVYHLAAAIAQTQKRANALKNVVLPRLSSQIQHISSALEEKEREEFSRLKVIKAQKENHRS